MFDHASQQPPLNANVVIRVDNQYRTIAKHGKLYYADLPVLAEIEEQIRGLKRAKKTTTSLSLLKKMQHLMLLSKRLYAERAICDYALNKQQNFVLSHNPVALCKLTYLELAASQNFVSEATVRRLCEEGIQIWVANRLVDMQMLLNRSDSLKISQLVVALWQQNGTLPTARAATQLLQEQHGLQLSQRTVAYCLARLKPLIAIINSGKAERLK